MRILMVASVDPTVPNASVTHLDGVAGELTAQGHHVTLVLPKPKTGKPVLDPAIRPFRIRYVGYGRRLGLPRILSVVVHTPWLMALNILHGFDLVYIRSNSLSFVLAAGMRLSGNAPVVTEHNGWICEELRIQRRAPWQQKLVRIFQVLDARASHVARCVTDGLARKFAEAGVPRSKLLVAGNGTDLKRFFPMPRAEALAQHGLPAERFYVGFIGSLAPWHGMAIAIEALPAIVAAHPGVHLLVAGDGAERAALTERARDLGVGDHITFMGHVHAERANSVVNCFDLAIAPFISERNSSIGLSPLKIRDYAAAGRPMLSTNIEGVAPEGAGQWIALCDPDDASAFADAATALIGNPERLVALGAAARQYAEAHFGWAAIVGKILLSLKTK